MRVKELIGRRFSLLVVVSRLGSSSQGKSMWACRCDCGGTKTASRDNLVSGSTTSCGCRKYVGFRVEHERRTKYRTVDDWLANCKPKGSCLEWQGYISPDGYANSGERLHRKIFRLIGGGSPQVVMHTCDNPKCINPEHLRAGTFKDNSQDMAQKGRAGRTVINHAQRLIVDEMLATGMLQEDVAALFGVTQSAVSSIHRRKK